MQTPGWPSVQGMAGLLGCQGFAAPRADPAAAAAEVVERELPAGVSARALHERRGEHGADGGAGARTELVFVAGRSVAVGAGEAAGAGGGLRLVEGAGLAAVAEALLSLPGAAWRGDWEIEIPGALRFGFFFLQRRRAAGTTTCTFAVDWADADRLAREPAAAEAESATARFPVAAAFQPIRRLFAKLPPDQLAVAGHAVAKVGWRRKHLFCGRCGEQLVLAEMGKLLCPRPEKPACPKLYPRTDPVIIMAVESVDGARVLLGRGKRAPPGLFTALAGFVEQAETIEDACRREVREESGVRVEAVSILGSQPWPIGRAGSCELMIGCMARAASSDDEAEASEELQEARWFTRGEIRDALERSGMAANPYNGGDGGGVGEVLWIPPRFAIAHHLLKFWEAQGAEAEEPSSKM